MPLNDASERGQITFRTVVEPHRTGGDGRVLIWHVQLRVPGAVREIDLYLSPSECAEARIPTPDPNQVRR